VTRSGWYVLVHDRRALLAVGAIAGTGAVLGAALASGVHRAPMFGAVMVSAMAVCIARSGWGWLRGRGKRRRLRESVLSRVEEYGGGVYGTGAAITLLILSSVSFQEEWTRAGGVMDFLRGMTLEFWLGFSAESIRNAIQAGIWPIHWYTNHGMVATLSVAAAAWAGDALADAWRKRGPIPDEPLGEVVDAVG